MLKIRKHQKIIVLVLDQLIIYFGFLIAFLLRFDFRWSSIPIEYTQNLIKYAPFFSIITFFIFFVSGLYRFIWRYISISDVVKIFAAALLTSGVNIIFSLLLGLRQPISVYIMAWAFISVSVVIIRLIPRLLVNFGLLDTNAKSDFKNVQNERVMIIGAGNAGEMLIKDILNNRKSGIKPICIVDDNPAVQKRTIAGIPIVGSTKNIVEISSDYEIDTILFAIPSIDEKRKKEILDTCNQTTCKLKIISSYMDVLTSNLSNFTFRDVTIEDLLGRPPVVTNLSEVGEYLTGKIILVTGAGGSIGSELCRQIAKLKPEKLILIDIYENNVYDIQLELLNNFPTLEIHVLIASVRDYERMNSIFAMYNPNAVFHAAAHKHVPLMEDSPMEAIKNNVQGTWNTARLADSHQVERFVLISTDKAVNPTNVMGASKRICEMIIQTLGKSSKTNFVAVRFGNVLGSNGSVVPIFKRQIEKGGPVTVTHPDIIRYFMTIPEAVALVLQAGAYAHRGEIYVLDMGEPVKILDLAKRMIRLSGNVPDKDIRIIFSGLRPGEKLYEEMLMSEEGLRTTPNHLIYIANPVAIDVDTFNRKIDILIKEANNNAPDITDFIQQIVPIETSK